MVATQLCKHQNPPTSTHERSRMLCIRKWYLSKEEEREGWKEKGNKEGSQEGIKEDLLKILFELKYFITNYP